PLDDAGRKGDRDGHAERRADGPGVEADRRAGGGVLESRRQERVRSPAEARWIRKSAPGGGPEIDGVNPSCDAFGVAERDLGRGPRLARARMPVLYSSGSVEARTPYLASNLRLGSGSSRDSVARPILSIG